MRHINVFEMEPHFRLAVFPLREAVYGNVMHTAHSCSRGEREFELLIPVNALAEREGGRLRLAAMMYGEHHARVLRFVKFEMHNGLQPFSAFGMMNFEARRDLSSQRRLLV